MTRISCIIAICMVATHVMAALDMPEPSRTVTVVGRSPGITEVAADEAKQDALREAVRQVCGSFIKAQSKTENYVQVYDKVLEELAGLARLVRVISGPEHIDGEITQVKIEAEVFPRKFEEQWVRFAVELERAGSPRCVIRILEDENTQDSRPPEANGRVQAAVEDFFLSKNVQLMDKGRSDEVQKRDADIAALYDDVPKLAAIGHGFKSDVIVVGKAEATPDRPVTLEGFTFDRWNVNLTIRVIQSDSAIILLSKTYEPKGKLAGKTGSARDCLLKLAREAAPDLLSDLGQAWGHRDDSKIIQVMIQPCTRKQFRAIQAAMLKLTGINGGENGFILRELVHDVATVDVNWKFQINNLADRFEELKVENPGEVLTFDIDEQSANRLLIHMNKSEGK